MGKGKFPDDRDIGKICQSVFASERDQQENSDGHDRKKRRVKKVYKSFRRGSGSSLVGISVMILVLLIIVIMLILFNMRSAANDAQMAADSLADGVAVFMANEGGTYEEACEKMEEIESLIASETGILIDEADLDEEALDNREARITVISSGNVETTTLTGPTISYTVTKTAVTKFRRRSVLSDVYGVDSDIDYVQWAIDIANDESHGYCLHDVYQGMGHPDYDCSSLVSFSLIENGYISYTFSTSGEYSALTGAGFTCLPYDESILQSGDILYRPLTTLEDGSTLCAHTEIYAGNGWIVGAHQSEDASQDYYYGQPGDQTGQEISVSMNDSAAKRWTRIFRLVSRRT